MLSLQFIREHADVVRKALADRHSEAPIDEIIELDEKHRALLGETERLRAEQNAAGKKIGAAKDPVERQGMIDEMKGVATRVDELTPTLREIDERLERLLLEVPNIPDGSAPYGESEDDNVVRSQSGEETREAWQKPHWDLGEALGIIDFERGVKLSGRRFFVLRGGGAGLERSRSAIMRELLVV